MNLQASIRLGILVLAAVLILGCGESPERQHSTASRESDAVDQGLTAADLVGRYSLVKDEAWWAARDLERARVIASLLDAGALKTIEEQREHQEAMTQGFMAEVSTLSLRADGTFRWEATHSWFRGRWRSSGDSVVLDEAEAPRHGAPPAPVEEDWSASLRIEGGLLLLDDTNQAETFRYARSAD